MATRVFGAVGRFLGFGYVPDIFAGETIMKREGVARLSTSGFMVGTGALVLTNQRLFFHPTPLSHYLSFRLPRRVEAHLDQIRLIRRPKGIGRFLGGYPLYDRLIVSLAGAKDVRFLVTRPADKWIDAIARAIEEVGGVVEPFEKP